MKSYKELDKHWVIGVFSIDGCHVFMRWGGDGHDCYIDSGTPEGAEEFDTAAQARRWLNSDENARRWHKYHPDARPLRVRSGFIVYAPR